MTFSVRDHSLPFNPFLQHLDLPTSGPVYWGRDGSLTWHDAGGRRSTRALDPHVVARWCSTRDPEDLWTQWGHLLSDERILLEHTSVNPVHPLHAGSLRGTVIGGALTRLFRSAGADVQVRYFVNDRGRQVTFLQRIAPSVDWRAVPSWLRPDETVGVLYALANMRHADRDTDIARLVDRHPWLGDVIDVTAALPPAVPPEDPGLVKTMVDCATEDMHLLGADIDVFDYESDLPPDLPAVALELIHHFAATTVNGTWCLRRPDGLVPLRRPDGTSLYFTRDLANTRLRLATRRRIVHVIGDDQILLQRALQDAVPEIPIEHVAFATVTDAGRRFSARQHRLLTIPDLRREGGTTGVWAIALAMLLYRRTTPINLTRLEHHAALDTVLDAHRTALLSPRHGIGADTIAPGSPPWHLLVQVILRAPGVLHRALRTRSPHASAALLVELSARYLDLARHHAVEGWLRDWFIRTQTRIAAVHGLRLDDLPTASPRPDKDRRTP